jgi:hypothetical protein
MAILLDDEAWEARERFGAGFIRAVRPQVIVHASEYFPRDIDRFLGTVENQYEALEWLGSSEAEGFVNIRKVDWIEVNPRACLVTFPLKGPPIEHPSMIGEIITYTFTSPATAFMFRMRFT